MNRNQNENHFISSKMPRSRNVDENVEKMLRECCTCTNTIEAAYSWKLNWYTLIENPSCCEKEGGRRLIYWLSSSDQAETSDHLWYWHRRHEATATARFLIANGLKWGSRLKSRWVKSHFFATVEFLFFFQIFNHSYSVGSPRPRASNVDATSVLIGWWWKVMFWFPCSASYLSMWDSWSGALNHTLNHEVTWSN